MSDDEDNLMFQRGINGALQDALSVLLEHHPDPEKAERLIRARLKINENHAENNPVPEPFLDGYKEGHRRIVTLLG